MTATDEELRVAEKLVVVFDICSSSNILEELVVRQDLRPLRNLLIDLKSFLKEKAARLDFTPYKFIGDGWILLFPINISGTALIDFLEELSKLFERRLKTLVVPRLERSPLILGLTFGIDVGPLVRITMLGNREYVGRPINVASRLQSAIKDKDHKPGYKVLFSKPAFNQLQLKKDYRKTERVSRKLRNIRNGERYACVKLWLKH